MRVEVSRFYENCLNGLSSLELSWIQDAAQDQNKYNCIEVNGIRWVVCDIYCLDLPPGGQFKSEAHYFFDKFNRYSLREV